LRRTLSVRLSVCLSVPLSSVTSRHLANYNDTHVLYGTRRGPHIVRPSRPHKFLFNIVSMKSPLISNTSRVNVCSRPCAQIFLTPSLITTQNVFVDSHTACAHVGSAKNMVDAGAWFSYDRPIISAYGIRSRMRLSYSL